MKKKHIPYIVLVCCVLLIGMHLVMANFNDLTLGFYVGIISAVLVAIAMLLNIRDRRRGNIK
ncbi:hypothetical protein MWU65_11625 [Cellulophaga sp. F20128]|uniref:hypothetical protein n=1 Tax=Cellulophaga sp. F20128 TaxID=2926413 RepID=UPI001FF4050A|nr:hypothetical protein [Cellulophaga sp. F20128]MCK0157834.1 hypothetical protein [Cellulophaga sp. F20128]